MNSLKRLIFFALLFGIQLLYFPLNRFLQGGVEFKTTWDAYIPVWPVWVVPYSLICVWWIVAYLWAAWRMDEHLYEAFFLASAIMQVTALMIFTFFPTYVPRTPLVSNDLFAQWLNWIYSNDHAYNAFPSGHVYITTLIALFWLRWYPKWRWLWISTIVIIFLATLFTGQHHLPDPIGGLALAWFSYYLGLWCTAKEKSRHHRVIHTSQARQ
jgi:membrane-associated phospholipid phosphatase